MTREEKAKELYWKYYQTVSDTSCPEETAEQCALIAVDEILNYIGEEDCIYPSTQFEYWQEVKQDLLNYNYGTPTKTITR